MLPFNRYGLQVLLVLAVSSLGAACSGGDTPALDAGAGGVVDGGRDAEDGGGRAVDGGTSLDAGVADGGRVDGGGVPDGGSGCTAGTCSGGRLCCGARCVDPFLDDGCHACNVTCSATQFCGTSQCVSAVFAGICELGRVVVVHDANSADDGDADALAAALPSACGRSIAIENASQTDPNVLDQASGRPRAAPGALLVVVGGIASHRATRYFAETAGLTKTTSQSVQGADGGTRIEYRRREDNRLLLNISTTTLTTRHDYFVVELVKEPTTKATVVLVHGLQAAGTRAAAFFVRQVLIPSRHLFGSTYYLIEWTSQSATELPTVSDRYDIHFHG